MATAQYNPMHYCFYEEDTLPGTASSGYSPYGQVHTPKGHLHGLVIFVNFTDSTTNYPNWAWNDIPDWAKGPDNELFNSTPATIGNTFNISSYNKTMSNPSAPENFYTKSFLRSLFHSNNQPKPHIL